MELSTDSLLSGDIIIYSITKNRQTHLEREFGGFIRVI
ncbi:hypothetical protein X559_0557 [Paenilisteria newyorkensis]|nr:hypothetical protein X559_0557 [Listeria newyorkensis]